MASMITATSKAEVKNEEDRLVAAKGSAESEKRLYVQVSFIINQAAKD